MRFLGSIGIRSHYDSASDPSYSHGSDPLAADYAQLWASHSPSIPFYREIL